VAPATLAIIRRLVAQRAMAEDLLQDTLIMMFEHLDDYRGEAPFGSLGAQHRREPLSHGVPFSPGIARASRSSRGRRRAGAGRRVENRTSDLIDLDRALARLSPTTRAVVWLYDVEGWSHEEIAKASIAP
jgi:RNA polymerase sigma-70 factor (ECF subfamily)